MGQEIGIDFSLAGRHQLRNLALAITAAEELNHRGFKILPRHVEQGVRDTRWPGRFEILQPESGTPEMVLDVAHNPAGAWALRSVLSTFYADRRLTFIFGAMRDKAIGEIANILFPLAERVIATQANSPRAATPREIVDLSQPTHTEIVEAPSVAAAVERARALAGAKGVVVITGSIYIVGEALGILAQSKIKAGQGV
jgi:dihydrofolate synthase/folylpolyglutamate synthase